MPYSLFEHPFRRSLAMWTFCLLPALPTNVSGQAVDYPEDWYDGYTMTETEASLIFRALRFFREDGLQFLSSSGIIPVDSISFYRAKTDAALDVVGVAGRELWTRRGGVYERPQPPPPITIELATIVDRALEVYTLTHIPEVERLVVSYIMRKMGGDGSLLAVVR